MSDERRTPLVDAVIGDDRNRTLFERLTRKTWDELEAIEHQSRLMFPITLNRRAKSGKLVEARAMARVPRLPELRQARIEARKIAESEGLDPSKDPDLFDDIDTVCVLQRCIRSTTPPHEPFCPSVSELEATFDPDSLRAAWSTLEALRTFVDPRPQDVSEEEVRALIVAIASTRTIAPLAAFAGSSQVESLVRMAEIAMMSPALGFSLGSSGSSTVGK